LQHARAAKSDAGRRKDRANPVFYLRDDAATGSSAHMHRTQALRGDEKPGFPCRAGDRYHAYFKADPAAKPVACRIAEFE
jgi:hypothetical protein